MRCAAKEGPCLPEHCAYTLAACFILTELDIPRHCCNSTTFAPLHLTRLACTRYSLPLQYKLQLDFGIQHPCTASPFAIRLNNCTIRLYE